MKKLILYLAIFLGIIQANAQQVDIIDSKGESLFKKNGSIKLKKNTTAVVKIEGINKNLYNIKINNEQFVFENKTESILSNFKEVTAHKDTKALIPKGVDKIALHAEIKNDPYIQYNPLYQYDLRILSEEVLNLYSIPNKKIFHQSYQKVSYKLSELKNAFDNHYNHFSLDTTISDSLHKYMGNRRKQIWITDSIVSLIDTTQYTFTYPLEIAAGDEMDIEVILTLKEDTTEIKRYSYRAPIYGEIKIDFNTSFVFDFFNADKEYSYIKNDDSSVKLIKEDTETSFTPSLAIFTNTYYKTKGIINPGLSLGIGISEETKLSYYGGLSALIGTNQRLVVTAGVSFVQRNRLKSQYKTGDIFNNDKKIDTPELVKKIYKPGFFIGIGYNLNTNRKSINKK